MSTPGLTGRTALVTGSTSGIGKAAAVALAEHGAHVIVSGRDVERGADIVKDITDNGGSAEFLAADLSTPAGARALAAAATADGRVVDVLVNSAGVFPFNPTALVPDTDLAAVLDTNVKAPHVLVAALAPLMAERGQGSIVNITSSAGVKGSAGQGIYGASKAALTLLTASWAAEFGPSGVRVNAVSPGPTYTEGTAPFRDMLTAYGEAGPTGRAGAPAEVAAAIVFLASDEASIINGGTIHADGGMHAV